ncbi:hypothetical protein BDF19DRAFT_479537 [Syncephalis fuscata]|nr:hypothetical protein BDF19DRAFT_479537 [Syncephalis fuscata]
MIMLSKFIAAVSAACATFLAVSINYVFAIPGIPTLAYSLNYINQGYNGLKVTHEYRNRHTAERFFSGYLDDGRFNNPVYVTCGDESDKKAETILFYKSLMRKRRTGEISAILGRFIAIPYAFFKVNGMTCYITSGECREDLAKYQALTLLMENGIELFMRTNSSISVVNKFALVHEQMKILGWNLKAEDKDICVNTDEKGDHVFLFAFDPFKLTNGAIWI